MYTFSITVTIEQVVTPSGVTMQIHSARTFCNCISSYKLLAVLLLSTGASCLNRIALKLVNHLSYAFRGIPTGRPS